MISKIILGTVQFGLDYGINNTLGKPSDEVLNSILDFAINQGVCVLDTAEAYGDSQRRIGEFHNQSKHRFHIITKYSSKVDLPSSIGLRVKDNLSTLNVDRLYSYMFHSFDEYNTYYSKFQLDLNSMVKDEIIGKLGVSVYTNDEALQVLEDDSIRLIQLPFNLLDNLSKRGLVLKKAKERGVEIHTRSVFLQGLFFKDLTKISNPQQSLKPYLERIVNLGKHNNITMDDLALNYALAQELISKVLIGVDNIQHLQSNINSANNKLSNKILQVIDKIDVKEIELLNPVNWK